MCPLCNTCKAWNMSNICTMAKVMGFLSTFSVEQLSLNHMINCDLTLKVPCPLAFQLGYLFDHAGTVFFSIFMSLWAVSFLEYWKRKMVTLAHHWDCMEFHEEEVSQSLLCSHKGLCAVCFLGVLDCLTRKPFKKNNT